MSPRLPAGRSVVIRRRRAVALAALALVAGGAGVGVALLVSSLEGGSGKPPDRLLSAALEAGPKGKGLRRPRAPAAVRRQVARLPLARAVAQLFVVGFAGRFPRDSFFAELRRRDWGGVVLERENFVDPGQLRALSGEVSVVARGARHLAPLVAADQPGGAASAIPGIPPEAPPDTGASGSRARARAQARAAGRALHGLDVDMTLAPGADVGTAAGPVEDRVFGDQAVLVSRLARSAVDGYLTARVIPVAGHFPGQGAASDDPDSATASVGLPLPQLRERDLRPFAALAPRVPVVMLSNAVYAAFDGVTPATLLPEAVALLRRELRFRGVVMSGNLSSAAPVVGESVASATLGALRAGCDLLYVSGSAADRERAYRAVFNAVRRERISRARIDVSLVRLLELKRRFGLLPGG